MKTMKYKVMKALSIMIIILGAISIYSTAGSSDLGKIDFPTLVIVTLIEIAVIILGIFILILSNYCKRRYEDRVQRYRAARKCHDNFIREMTKLGIE